LVVENDADSLDLLRFVFEDAGAVVIAVPSARAALDVQCSIDVVVSDIGLPEIDGCVLIQRLRSRPLTAAVPAIALTAYADHDHVERALAAGYNRCIPKPAELTQLIATVLQAAQERPPTR
jgi:CheY-like chemotaxis protein